MSDQPAASPAENAAKGVGGGAIESAAPKAATSNAAPAAPKPLREQNAAFRMMGASNPSKTQDVVEESNMPSQDSLASAYHRAIG